MWFLFFRIAQRVADNLTFSMKSIYVGVENIEKYDVLNLQRPKRSYKLFLMEGNQPLLFISF